MAIGGESVGLMGKTIQFSFEKQRGIDNYKRAIFRRISTLKLSASEVGAKIADPSTEENREGAAFNGLYYELISPVFSVVVKHNSLRPPFPFRHLELAKLATYRPTHNNITLWDTLMGPRPFELRAYWGSVEDF
jgi:hypothetical protein